MFRPAPVKHRSMSEPRLKLPLAREPYRIACSTSGCAAKTAPMLRTTPSFNPNTSGSSSGDIGELRHFLLELREQREVMLQYQAGDFVGGFLVIGMRRLVAAFNHPHPGFAVADQVILKRLARRVAGA